MANTKVTQHVIANNAITADQLASAAVTDAKLHSTLDLSGKTLTLPATAIPSASTGTTQAASDNSTKLATTAYVTTAIANLNDSAPTALNTLNELAAALNDDASFSSTVTTSLAGKLSLTGGTMTGQILAANGTASAPSYAFSSQGSTGMYKPGTSQLYFSVSGTRKLRVEAAQVVVETALYANTTLGVTGVATFADEVTMSGTGALKIPVGTTGQRPTAATGKLRFNSTDGKLEIYNGSAWSNVSAGTSNKVLDTFTGDNSTTAFTLTETPANEDALIVFIDGSYQEKGDYSLSGKVLTLDVAPLSGEKIAVHTTIGAVHDGTAALNQQFTGDGSTTAFTLSVAPQHENNTQIYINGVYQQKTDYTVSGTTLTFDTAPTSGDIIEVNSFTVTNLGGSDSVTEGVSNLYHTTARARGAISVSGNAISYNSSTGVLTANFEEGPVFTSSVQVSGNNHIGIGGNDFNTTAGTNTLTVGTVGSTTGGIQLFSPTNGEHWINWGDTNSSTGRYMGRIGYNHSDNDLMFYSSGTEKMRITAGGDVSIGSDHSGFSGWRVLNIRGASANDGALINFENSAGTRSATFANQSIGMRYQTHISGGYHHFETEGTPNGYPLYIANGGNVGIGTGIPAAKLHISGNSDTSDEDCQLIIDDVDGSAGSRIPSIQFRSNTGGTVTNQGRIRATDTQGMILSGSSAQDDDIVVQEGKVGMGTNSPAVTKGLHINSTSDTQLRLTTSAGANTPTAQMAYSTGSGGYFLRLADGANNEDVMFRTYGDSVINGGAVTMSKQPGFFARGNTSQWLQGYTSSWNTIVAGIAHANGTTIGVNLTEGNTGALNGYDAGSDFNTSNGRFTAPIAGKYLIHGSLYAAKVGTNANDYMHFLVYVNGQQINQMYTMGGHKQAYAVDFSLNLSTVLRLDANDYVEWKIYTTSTDIRVYADHMCIGAHMIS